MSMSDYEKFPAKDRARIMKRINVANGVVPLRAKEGYRGKPFMVRVWDKRARKYDDEAFDTEEAMILHAEITHRSFQTGSAAAGSVLLTAIRPRFMASARQECGGKHLFRYDLMFDRMKEYGIEDLKSSTIVADTIEMLEDLALGAEPVFKDGKRIKRRQRPWKNGTWNSNLSMLKTIGHWCTVRANRILLQDNPFEPVPERKVNKALPDLYTIEELKKLVADGCLNTEIGRFLALSIYTGMRLNETRWLSWSAIDWHAGVIKVTIASGADHVYAKALGIDVASHSRDGRKKAIKASEERVIFLERELAALLKPVAGVTGYVFSDRFLALKSEQIMWRANQVFRKLKIRKRARAVHVLRHAYASMLDGAGLARGELKRRLGHSPKCNTTEDYLRSAHVIAKDVAGWGREIRLRTGCNQGATATVRLSHYAVVTQVQPMEHKQGSNTGYDQSYDNKRVATTQAASDYNSCMLRFPIQLTGVRFSPPAHAVSNDFVVVLEDDKKFG